MSNTSVWGLCISFILIVIMAFAEVGMIKSIDIDRELKKQDKLIQQLHRPEISNVPHTINYNGHKYVLKP